MSKYQSVHESSPESRFYTDPCTPRLAVRAPCGFACLTSLYYVPIAVTTISLFRFPFPFPFSVSSVYSCLDASIVSLVDQTTPSAALDVLHHQHAKEGSGHSGRVFVTQRNAHSWEMHIIPCSMVTSVSCRQCIDLTPDRYKLC